MIPNMYDSYARCASTAGGFWVGGLGYLEWEAWGTLYC